MICLTCIHHYITSFVSAVHFQTHMLNGVTCPGCACKLPIIQWLSVLTPLKQQQIHDYSLKLLSLPISRFNYNVTDYGNVSLLWDSRRRANVEPWFKYPAHTMSFALDEARLQWIDDCKQCPQVKAYMNHDHSINLIALGAQMVAKRSCYVQPKHSFCANQKRNVEEHDEQIVPWLMEELWKLQEQVADSDIERRTGLVLALLNAMPFIDKVWGT